MAETNTYDEVPYPDLAFPQTHPNRTAAMASLFGLTPPDPRTARVLELGCAAGANLLPMGVEMPEAEFLGLDLSAAQIQVGEAIRREAGITNVTLRQADLLELDASLGQFDYIIAHGLFSWVPPAVAEKLLAVCRKHLAPNGIAYISYNVFPGWHSRGALRGMMMYHTAGFADPAARIQQARALLDFVGGAAKKDFYADMLKAGAALVREGTDNYLFHEYLETENHPIYFHEFVRLARASGLEYLGGTQLPAAALKAIEPSAVQVLQRIAGNDPVRMEQYADFVTNRTFRESLLVHQEQAISRNPDWKPLRQFWFSHWLYPTEGTFDPALDGSVTFASRNGVKIALKDPFAKSALAIQLENNNRAVAFGDLLAGVRSRVASQRSAAADEQELADFVLELLGHGVAEISTAPWPDASRIDDRPRVSRLARLQAGSGRTVVNLRHQRMDGLSSDHRGLLELFDGETTVEQAIDRMFGKIDRNRLPESARGATNDPAKLRALFGEAMHRAVADLRDLGLFMDCGQHG